jgi:integrase
MGVRVWEWDGGKNGQLDGNPAANSTRWLLRSANTQKRQIDIITKPELQTLLKRAEARSPMTYVMVLTLARTRIRISELMGLRLEDLDFERREMHVRRTWGNQSRGPDYTGIPKSSKPRIVDMSQQLCAALQAYVVGRPEEGWLFPSKTGLPMTPNSFYPTHWKPLFDAVIAYRHPHVLRHTYATQLLWQGQSPVFVKEQLGHSSIRISVDPYGHAIRSSDKSAVDQLDDPDASLRNSDASNDIRSLKLIKGGLA